MFQQHMLLALQERVDKNVFYENGETVKKLQKIKKLFVAQKKIQRKHWV